MTIETARELIPAGSHVEMDKLLELDLNEDSLALVVGSFKGLTAHIIYEAYGCNMICYDPQPVMGEQLRERLLPNSKIEVRDYGLGSKNGSFPMWEIGNDACSFFSGNSERDPGEGYMRDVGGAVPDAPIDLLFMNCEGSEYDILDRLYEIDLMKNVRLIMVQFHLAVTKGNGGNYDKYVSRLKEDYATIWTVGAPWTLYERYDADGVSRPSPSPGLDTSVDDEKPGCLEPECDFKPGPEKDYDLSMAAHKRSHMT